ncbi:hypothetical protein K1719_001767 [Acacia pycnantha]|nr:hypothetical protein K1719_001767 [Acacia pycnantha]
MMVMEDEAKLVLKNDSDCENNGTSSAAGNGKYDLCGRTPTPEVTSTMDEISPASLVNHDAGITDRSESILISLRNCFHVRVGLASFVVVVGGALVLVLSNGTIRPEFRLYLGIRGPNIGTSRWFVSNKLLFVVLVAFNSLIILAAEHMPFFEWIMDAMIRIELSIPLIQLLYLLLPPHFWYFFSRKDLNRDGEITQTEDISPIEEGFFSDETVNTGFVIQAHDSAADSISDTTDFSPRERRDFIGAGGYGNVYVARNRKTGDLCAVKELENVENAESIRKKIKILCQLKHPNIVKYYGHEEDGHKISIYMEFIQPGSLKKYILKRGALHETLIRKFTAQILSGLVYLHSKRVVHRDLKPDNILVDSQDIIKLVDFGVSKHLVESVGNHSTWGTLYYAAPEVFQKSKYKSSREAYAADIWSLGCAIIEMFSGKHPWPGFEPQQAFYNVSMKRQHPPIPDKLCSKGKDFLKLCFKRTPADRPSAAELQDHPFVKPQNLSC